MSDSLLHDIQYYISYITVYSGEAEIFAGKGTFIKFNVED